MRKNTLIFPAGDHLASNISQLRAQKNVSSPSRALIEIVCQPLICQT